MSAPSAWGIPTTGDPLSFLPQILAVLIDRAGGEVTLSDRDVERIAHMRPDLEFSVSFGFDGDVTHIRYRDRMTISAEAAEVAE